MTSFDAFRDTLRARFASGAPLPGRAAQLALCPPWRRQGFDADAARAAGYRRASVLILLYPDPTNGATRFPLIVRQAGTGPHAGQIALPGGAAEAGETDEAAALREAAEELGADAADGYLLGALSPFPVDVSRFLVTPFVGVFRGAAAPVFRPAPAEVAEWFSVTIDELLDPAARGEAFVEVGASAELRAVPCYYLGGRVVWGATAMALAELAELAAACAVRSQTPAC